MAWVVVIWFWSWLNCCSFCLTLRGSNRYGRSPECSTGTTEFSTSLSYKFTKFQSLSFDKLSSELVPLSRSSIDFSYGIPVAQCLCSTAYVTRDGYCFHQKWIFSHCTVAYSKINGVKNFTQSEGTNKEPARLAWEASLARNNLDFLARTSIPLPVNNINIDYQKFKNFKLTINH